MLHFSKNRPVTFDPFLHPLMEERVDLFINGMYRVVVFVQHTVMM